MLLSYTANLSGHLPFTKSSPSLPLTISFSFLIENINIIHPQIAPIYILKYFYFFWRFFF